MNYQFVKHQNTSFFDDTGRMLPVAKILADNTVRLTDSIKDRPARPELAAKMGLGDKTLGFIRSGTGNPTLDSIAKLAKYFRLQPWELLHPEGALAKSQSARPDDQNMAQGVELLYLMADARPEDKRLKRPTWAMFQIAGKAVERANGDSRAAMAEILAELAKEN